MLKHVGFQAGYNHFCVCPLRLVIYSVINYIFNFSCGLSTSVCCRFSFKSLPAFLFFFFDAQRRHTVRLFAPSFLRFILLLLSKSSTRVAAFLNRLLIKDPHESSAPLVSS